MGTDSTLTQVQSVLVEACVDSVESAHAAERGGAARVELCAALGEGGTTPSAGTIAAVREVTSIPMVVLVRPRAGDFLYSEREIDVMRADIAAAKALGAHGVAVGALTADGTIDAERMRVFVDIARPMDVTFHRAFDFTRDPTEALDTLMQLGVDRVLTSGHAANALEGILALAALVAQAGNELAVMAGGSINAENVERVVAGSGVREVHLRGADRVESAMKFRRPEVALGKPHAPEEYAWTATSEELIAAVVNAVV